MDIKLEATAEDYRRHVRSLLERELPTNWRGVAALDPDQRARFDETWRAFR